MKENRLAALVAACSLVAASGVSAQTAAPAPAPAAAAPAAPSTDFVVYSQIVSSRRNPESLGDAINGVMSNPVIGPVIVIGAAYLGVPPEAVASLGAAAASAQQEQMRKDRATPRRGYHIDYLKPPAGYSVCAARFGALSIHPESENRPKVSAAGSLDAVTMSVQHQSQSFGRGRSTVKVKVDMLAVKTDQLDKYKEQCRLTKAQTTLIPLCRGSECDAPMNGTAWRNGG
jgi:hypothetical protein